MNNQVSERYIELSFRYIAALYQQAMSAVFPTVKDKVKLESYQNESPVTRRKYYVDKMYHTLAAATRAKLMASCGFESVKLFVRRFIGYGEDSLHPNTSRILYYVAPLPRHLAVLYAKYIALIWVMKQKSFLRKLLNYGSDLTGGALTSAIKYTFYEGELADFLRIPFRKMQGRGRYHNFNRNYSSFGSFLLKYSYLLGDRPAADATGVWAARKSLAIPLYVPGPRGTSDYDANQVHVGHNQKTLTSMMFLLRLMNALEPAGNQKILGAKKIDDGQAFAHQAMSALFLGPIFESWMTSIPVYSHCNGDDARFNTSKEMAGYFFGDFPITGSAEGSVSTGDTNLIAPDTCDGAANIMVRHALVKAGLETRDAAVIKQWIERTAKESTPWIENLASNFFATWQFGLQGVEMGTDSKFWAIRRIAHRSYRYGEDTTSGEVQPEPFCLSYLAKTELISKTLTDQGEIKPIISPSATDPRVVSVKNATDLFPHHIIRDLLMAENTDELLGFTLSAEPTNEEINRLADYLMANVSNVTVQYEPVLNMIGALSSALDNGLDHIKAYTKIGLILRGYKRFNKLPADLQQMPTQDEKTDEPNIPDSDMEPSWVSAVKYAGDGIAFSKDAAFLNELLDGKIEAAINLKNYNGRQEDARPARAARTRAPRTVS